MHGSLKSSTGGTLNTIENVSTHILSFNMLTFSSPFLTYTHVFKFTHVYKIVEVKHILPIYINTERDYVYYFTHSYVDYYLLTTFLIP